MAEIFVWTAVLVISLAVLIKASDYFTSSAEKVGLYLGMPVFIVGVTIVAVGTSLPELISSIIAVLDGASEIVVGNVVGSNITNIFLIIGLAAIVGRKLITTYEIIHVDLPMLVGSAFLFALTIWDGTFTITEAILLIAGMLVYFFYTVKSDRKRKDEHIKKELKQLKKEKVGWKTIAVLLVSAAFIFVGAKYTVTSVVMLSSFLNIGREIIALTAVALGTSLPELAVSASAAWKGKSEIAIGNVIGSNIFNAFAVMGIPAFFGSLAIPATIISFSLPLMLIATILFFFIVQEKEITSWEGWMLLLFYAFFLGKTFSLF